MRRWLLGALALVAVLAAGFFLFAPGYVEAERNVIDGGELPEISAEAQKLHDTLTIVDLHGDTLLWQRDLIDRADRGHIDLPRLQEGNVALQVFSSVTKTPRGQNYDHNSGDTDNITLLVFGQLQPVRTWGSLLERSLWHATKLERAVDGSEGELFVVRQPDNFAHVGEGKVGAMISIEGLHNLEGDIANLARLYDAGFRMGGLTHFFDNELAGSAHGMAKGGLTPFGKEVVREMEQRGMIVDIAHCSAACIADVLKMARRPVVSSHGGVQGTCPGPRNLSDEQIRGIAKTGGLIGIGYWEGAVCDTSPAAIAKAMRYTADLVGVEYVALGSDFDGSVATRFDTSQLAQVTQALMQAGLSEGDISAIMGGNALRVLRQGITPLAKESD